MTKSIYLMLKSQILASEVSNLTDARYFAAWGVDFMSFNCNAGESSFIETPAILEILEWVEGPINLASFSGLQNPEQIESLIEAANLGGAILGPFTPESTVNFLDLEHRFVEKVFSDNLIIGDNTIIKIEKKNLDKLEIQSSRNVFLDCSDLDMETVDQIITRGDVGIVVRGGEEEKVGLKSFDFLDDVFDLLMD